MQTHQIKILAPYAPTKGDVIRDDAGNAVLVHGVVSEQYAFTSRQVDDFDLPEHFLQARELVLEVSPAEPHQVEWLEQREADQRQREEQAKQEKRTHQQKIEALNRATDELNLAVAQLGNHAFSRPDADAYTFTGVGRVWVNPLNNKTTSLRPAVTVGGHPLTVISMEAGGVWGNFSPDSAYGTPEALADLARSAAQQAAWTDEAGLPSPVVALLLLTGYRWLNASGINPKEVDKYYLGQNAQWFVAGLGEAALRARLATAGTVYAYIYSGVEAGSEEAAEFEAQAQRLANELGFTFVPLYERRPVFRDEAAALGVDGGTDVYRDAAGNFYVYEIADWDFQPLKADRA